MRLPDGVETNYYEKWIINISYAYVHNLTSESRSGVWNKSLTNVEPFDQNVFKLELIKKKL